MRYEKKTFEKNPTSLSYVAILLLVVFAIVFGRAMYSGRNLSSMAFQMPEFGFVTLGMMLAFLLGGIDLSIIANANLSGILAAHVLTGQWLPFIPEGMKIPVAIIGAILVSAALGSFNGLLITRFGAPSLIATLGTMTLYAGIGMAITGGKSIVGFPEAFTRIGIASLAGVPIIFIMFIIVAFLMGLFLERSRLGRKIYLCGESPVASLFSGIHNDRIIFIVFTIIGVLAGLSGLTIISRVNSAKVGYGDAYLLQSLIVCVIGGINPLGGRGRTIGIVIAVILMQMLSSSFTIMQLSPYATKMIWGLMLVVVMGLTRESDRIRRLSRRISEKVGIAKRRKDC
jgi:simple sugar transport system permease protein